MCGAEVQRPLATVVIGGVLGAMIMSLLVLRVLYLIFNTAFERTHAIGHHGDEGTKYTREVARWSGRPVAVP